MPIVNKEIIQFKGKPFEKSTTYSSRIAKFRIDLPPEVVEFRDCRLKYVEADSEKEANVAFWCEVNQFLSVDSKKDKVILYKFEWDSHIERDGKIINETQFRLESKTKSMIKLEYKIAYRHRVGEGISYFDENGNHFYPGGEKVIEWTAEREQFFHQVKFQMDNAILQVKKFMKLNPKSVVNLIDGRLATNLLEFKEK
jgi:hypothetical protein